MAKKYDHINGEKYSLKQITDYAIKHEGPWTKEMEEGYIELYGHEIMEHIKKAKGGK